MIINLKSRSESTTGKLNMWSEVVLQEDVDHFSFVMEDRVGCWTGRYGH